MGNTLYEQFHNNVQGVTPLNNAKDSLNGLQTTYEQVRDNLTQALSGIKATYTGNAADAMSDAFTPLANSFNDGANFAGSAALSADFQATSFATAQAKIQNQVPVPAAPWYEPVDPFNTDHDDAINQNSQIDSANEAAYGAYGNDTTGNLGYVQPAPTSTSGFGNFSATQQGSGRTVGSPSGSAGSSGAGSAGGGSAGRASNYQSSGNTPSGYVAPSSGTSPSSQATNPGGGGTPPGQTSTSGYTPPPSTGPGDGNGTPGGGYPIGGGSAPGGTGGSQIGGDGPGSLLGPLGGTGGLGGGGVGGGSASSVGRGGFGTTGSGGAGAGGASGSGARSGVGSAAGVGEEAEMEGAAAGRSGASGMPGAMGGRGGRGGEDQEHKTASYLINEDNGNLIVGDFDPVSPPVLGE
jgi:hypothetical protein